MRPLEHLLVSALGYKVLVAKWLPYRSKDKDGNDLGMVHWVVEGGDRMLVSQEMFDKLKELPSGKRTVD